MNDVAAGHYNRSRNIVSGFQKLSFWERKGASLGHIIISFSYFALAEVWSCVVMRRDHLANLNRPFLCFSRLQLNKRGHYRYLERHVMAMIMCFGGGVGQTQKDTEAGMNSCLSLYPLPDVKYRLLSASQVHWPVVNPSWPITFGCKPTKALSSEEVVAATDVTPLQLLFVLGFQVPLNVLTCSPFPGP